MGNCFHSLLFLTAQDQDQVQVQVHVQDNSSIRVVVRKKRDYVGKITKLWGGLTQTHFLMSIYQVIFGCQNDSEVFF